MSSRTAVARTDPASSSTAMRRRSMSSPTRAVAFPAHAGVGVGRGQPGQDGLVRQPAAARARTRASTSVCGDLRKSGLIVHHVHGGPPEYPPRIGDGELADEGSIRDPLDRRRPDSCRAVPVAIVRRTA
jgi:hypothetical protein